MNVASYREKKRLLLTEETNFRKLCLRCRHPEVNCYCPLIKPFSAHLKFVILMHKIEARRRVATGRLSHLSLKESELIIGHDFSEDAAVNGLIANPAHHCVVLYPGRGSQNLTEISSHDRAEIFPKGKTPVIFVIDGTWNTARQMIRSRCFADLPRVCFTPPTVSGFQVRKQPGVQCYSTLEAIHHTIELLGPGQGFDLTSRRHDALLTVFRAMVTKQLEYVRESHKVNLHSRHWRDKQVS